MRYVSLSLLLLAACTGARPAAQTESDFDAPRRLLLENASADPVRVYLELQGRQLLLGRISAFETTSLRVPAGVVHPGSGDARILIVPLATPQPIMSAGNMLNGIRSDSYSAYEFLRTPWRYSGHQVVMVLTGRDY